MKEITFTSNFGNINYELLATVDDETLLALAGKGLGQIAQRTPCTNAEKELAGESWPKNKKGGPIRPPGFERNTIPFSKENAEILKAHLEEFKNKDSVKLGKLTVTVSEYEAKVESKWAAEKSLIAGKNGDAVRLIKLAEKVGYEVEDDDADTLTADNVEFCKAIRAFQKALLAREMAD